MPYDENQASRFRHALRAETAIDEIKMFGGVCFMLHGHMLCGVGMGGLMFRVGGDAMAEALKRPGASVMELKAGMPMTGIVKVDPARCDDAQLVEWLAMARTNALSLPPKAAKAKKAKPR